MSAGALIIGAGQAGVQLASSLRQAGYPDPVTLLGAEPHPPYHRPRLSTAEFFDPHAEPPTVALRAPDFYRQQQIRLLLNEQVKRITLDPAGRGGAAYTRSGRRIPFTRIALTTGARPRRLTVPGAELAGVNYLRDLDDARWLRDALTTAGRLVVIGGGFLGLEAASVAVEAGVAVTVIEAADRLLPRVVAPAVSTLYQQAHQRRGVTLRLGAAVTAIAGEQGRVREVVLADGTTLPADLVVVAIGVQPRTELAEQTGLTCSGGVLVDAYARTSHPAVVAAGDCTIAPHPRPEQGHCRLESVPNAIAQARMAAATIAGTPPPAPEVPWFWSDQFDLKLQMVGLTDGCDAVVLRGATADEQLTVLYYRCDELIAVHAVNNPPDYLAGRLALSKQIPLPASSAADPELRLRDLVSAARVAR